MVQKRTRSYLPGPGIVICDAAIDSDKVVLKGQRLDVGRQGLLPRM